MKAFKYTVATSAADASEKLGPSALAFAGGASLLNLMKEHVVEPDVLVDVKRLPGTRDIDLASGRIGANVTIAEIADHGGLGEQYPALVQAAREIATPQIRNRGTLAGNLCSRPACWYFSHQAFDCAKKGGEGCPARSGENEYHAIFDTDGPCVMVHASSLAPALIALASKVHVAGPNGERTLDLEQFFADPSRDITRENVLGAKDVVTGVTLGAARAHSATYEVRQKASHDWPVSLASVALDMKFGSCASARVVLGAVAPTPRRVPAAEAALAGKRITREVAEAAAEAAVQGASPLAQNAYKVQTTKAAVTRAVLLAGTGRWK